MEKKVLNLFIEKGFLVDKETLQVFEKIEDLDSLKKVLDKIKQNFSERIINKSFLLKNSHLIKKISVSYDQSEKKVIERLLIDLGLSLEITREIDKNVNEADAIPELKDFKILNLGHSAVKKIAVEDFVKHFKSRYNMIKRILVERPELENLTSINKISANTQFSIIGLVFDKRATKNKNLLLVLEDPTGRVNAIVNKNRPEVFEKAKEILLDDIVGFKCSGSKEIVFVNDLFFPDAMLQEKKRSKVEELVAFISDLHIGSNKFLESNFLKFIDWINGNAGSEEQKKEALKIKYLFITGDSVDGVGIFPGQENDLVIKDIKEQYIILAQFLEKIRKDVKIIICPGQHDAVRVAEPQPIIDENYASPLYKIKNIFLVTNPSVVEIGSDTKFKVLMYHGASMHGVINEIEKLRFGKGHDSPTEVVKYLLKKRHLAPTHSSVVYIPNEKEDPLVIKDLPDIVSTGDLHRSEIAQHNNILLVASSCWQSITPFEEKVGNNPDPCKVPILNLKTRQIKILDFSGE